MKYMYVGIIKKILKTIEKNYKKALYYLGVFPIIEEILLSTESNLAKYLESLVKER